MDQSKFNLISNNKSEAPASEIQNQLSANDQDTIMYEEKPNKSVAPTTMKTAPDGLQEGMDCGTDADQNY
jgi:hypothetical protein